MTYRCLGSLVNVKSVELHNKVKEIIPNVKGRPRLFGYDIEIENDELELSINTYDEKEYNIDILTKNIEDLINLLDRLKNSLISIKGSFDLVYFQQGENGKQITNDKLFFSNLK